MTDISDDQKRIDGTCATGSMGCLLPVAVLIAFAAAIVIGAVLLLVAGPASLAAPLFAFAGVVFLLLLGFGVAFLLFVFGPRCAIFVRCCCCGDHEHHVSRGEPVAAKEG